MDVRRRRGAVIFPAPLQNPWIELIKRTHSSLLVFGVTALWLSPASAEQQNNVVWIILPPIASSCCHNDARSCFAC